MESNRANNAYAKGPPKRVRVDTITDKDKCFTRRNGCTSMDFADTEDQAVPEKVDRKWVEPDRTMPHLARTKSCVREKYNRPTQDEKGSNVVDRDVTE